MGKYDDLFSVLFFFLLIIHPEDNLVCLLVMKFMIAFHKDYNSNIIIVNRQ